REKTEKMERFELVGVSAENCVVKAFGIIELARLVRRHGPLERLQELRIERHRIVPRTVPFGGLRENSSNNAGRTAIPDLASFDSSRATGLHVKRSANRGTSCPVASA